MTINSILICKSPNLRFSLEVKAKIFMLDDLKANNLFNIIEDHVVFLIQVTGFFFSSCYAYY